MAPQTRISLTNLFSLGGLAIIVLTPTVYFYGDVRASLKQQEEVNQHLKETDERLESRELAIDVSLREIRESQIRIEEQFKKRAK